MNEGVHYSQLDADLLLDTEFVATWLGLSRSALEKMRVYGGGPLFVKIGSKVRYRVQAIRDYLARNELAAVRVAANGRPRLRTTAGPQAASKVVQLHPRGSAVCDSGFKPLESASNQRKTA